MRIDPGAGAIALLLLATALAVLLTTAVPITVSKDAVELKDWLGFAGNVLGAGVTLLAAVIAWHAVQRQIDAQFRTAEQERLRKEFAARGVIPLSLSALNRYASDCLRALEKLPRPVLVGTKLELPPLPRQDVQELRDAIESMEATAARQLVETLHFLQIQYARLHDFEQRAYDGSLTDHEVQRRIIDAADLYAFETVN